MNFEGRFYGLVWRPSLQTRQLACSRFQWLLEATGSLAIASKLRLEARASLPVSASHFRATASLDVASKLHLRKHMTGYFRCWVHVSVACNESLFWVLGVGVSMFMNAAGNVGGPAAQSCRNTHLGACIAGTRLSVERCLRKRKLRNSPRLRDGRAAQDTNTGRSVRK